MWFHKFLHEGGYCSDLELKTIIQKSNQGKINY